MPKIIFVLLLFFIKEYYSFEANGNSEKEANMSISSGISQKFDLSYLTETNFYFKEEILENSELQINIHSINCKIEVSSDEEILINKISLELYYLIVTSNASNFSILPLADKENGEYKENYGAKECPVIINSYYVSNNTKQNLQIDNKEENFIFFDASIYDNTFHISYDVNKVSKNSFISLFFRYESEASFDIDITYTNRNNSNSTSKIIEKTSFIYLNSEFLLYDNDDKGTLSINIKNIKFLKNLNLFFKIIEENNICLLEKDKLNFGFITSNSKCQYYYTEILKGEEGELILHNKRLYGVLHAKIINNISDINNISGYPHNKTELEYNEHKLKLKYSYENTLHCFNGCYILITYEQKLSEEDFPLIGYEYTILSRTWNYADSVSKLIDIPPNEYIIGCFGEGSSPQHFYSIHIPDDVDKIIIQLEGNYIESYYMKKRKKINIWSPFDKNEADAFELNNNKNVTTLNKEKLENKKDLSFLFIPQNYFDISLSYYYFRVLFIKKDENSKYIPIDSNLGNLCLPELITENSTENLTKIHYYCNLILKNNYDELNNTNFAISSDNQNELVKINVSIISDSMEIPDNNSFVYVYDYELYKNVSYILFTFEFENNETKTIISSFCDRIENIYPHIYSGQMYYLDNFTKNINFNMKNKFYLKYQFIHGDSGYFNYSLPLTETITATENFKGKPITIQLDNNTNNIPFYTYKEKHIFYTKIIDNAKMIGVKEITDDEPLTQFLTEFYLPLYYYLRINSKEHATIDVNIKLKDYSDIGLNTKYMIKGYLIDEKTLARKINGEIIKVDEPILGTYSDIFGIGFLQVNQDIKNNERFLLIEIDSENKSIVETIYVALMEISAKIYDESNKNIMLPVNKYIIESFNGRNEPRSENIYFIYVPEGNGSETWIDISTDFDDIKITFDDDKIKEENKNKNEKGFKKYKINRNSTFFGIFSFKVKNTKLRNANYLIRYSYHDSENINYYFQLDENYTNSTKIENNSREINYTFNKIELETSQDIAVKRAAYFITGTLYKKKEGNSSNNTYVLNVIDSRHVSKARHYYNETHFEENWTLVFKDFPKENYDEYEMQLQIQAYIIGVLFNDEYLLYKINVTLHNETETKTTDEDKPKNWWKWLLGGGLIFIALLVALIILIKFLKLKKKNSNFQQEMKSLLFSNDIQKNVLIKEKKISRNENDFESTFI